MRIFAAAPADPERNRGNPGSELSAEKDPLHGAAREFAVHMQYV